jgi:Aspartyl/Asparaginyl beta-hydroxylase/Tetratricopeptide repeat
MAISSDSTERQRRADALAASGDFAAARKILKEIVATSPTPETWLKIGAMCRADGDLSAALEAVQNALAIDPLNFMALLMRATLLHTLGKEDDAGLAYGRALAQAPDDPPPSMAPVLDSARGRYGRWQEQQASALRSAVTQNATLSPALDRMITNAVRLTAAHREGPTHYCHPDLPEVPFFDRALFPWLPALEGVTDVIRAEFEAAAGAQAAELVPYIQYPETVPVAQWRELNHNPAWTAIHLLERGQIVEANARHCPQTMALLEAIPQPKIHGAGPNVMFSLLAPNTHIPPHTGIANTRLVCHLPLVVPDGCWFRVGNETRFWERGKAWIFDDTVEHEAMNPTDRLRVILIFDMWHPDLTANEREGVAAVIGAGGRIHGL